MLIDMHAHVIPGRFPEGRADWPRMEPADVPDARQLVTDRMRFTAKHTFYNAEARVEAMAADGVDVEVVSPLPPLLDYDREPEDARDFCRHVNEFIADLCRAAPGRIFGLGTVPLQDPDLAAAELSEITRMGLAGIEIGSNVRGTSLGDERLRDFFAEAERLRVPIFVHATNPTFADRVPAGGLGTFGFATEISLAAASVVSSGLAEQCPDLRIAFSHGAGGFPLMLTRAQYFWSGVWDEGERDPQRSLDRDPTPRSPTGYARRLYYDALVFDRRALRYLIDMLGADRLIVGTDFPAMPREQPAGRTLRSMGLPQDDLDAITWHNCFRFLGVQPPAA